MPMITHAMLMTAGLGTRLAPFTQFQSKILLPILGIPVVQFTLDALENAGINQVVANVHYDPDHVRTRIKSMISPKVKLYFSDETEQLLGSAGGIRHALPLLGGGPFFLANADMICDIDWEGLAEEHERLRRRWGVLLTLAVFPSALVGESYREILFDKQSRLIKGVGERQAHCPFFIGAAVLEPEALGNVPSEGVADFVETILVPAIRQRRAGVFLTQGAWFDVGSPSLWLQTQIDLMTRLETGSFASSEARRWRAKIETMNCRLAERIWVDRASVRPKTITGWQSPCYWHAGPEQSVAPRVLGPNAVLYGSVPEKFLAQSGIGMGGIWVSR